MDAFGVFKAARESLWPVLTTTAFIERGVLTPEEFIKAGDHLVHTCRTWTWESGDPANVKSYLPADKQYLHIRRVPSYRRVNSLVGANIKEVVVKGDDAAGGDWCSTEVSEQRNVGLGDGVMVDISELLEGTDGAAAGGTGASSSSGTAAASSSATVAAAPAPAPAPAKASKSAADEYVDMDMEDDSLALDDSAVEAALTAGSAGAGDGEGDEGGGVVYTRRYDVSITYDKYWQTPRIWLFGYDEAGNALPPLSIFDDIIQDYAKKTVTIELHPHLGTPHASIHPCQHAAAMLRIIEALGECGKVPSVEQYMFIFLKFMQSVMPTIEYDTTFDVQIGGGGGGGASSAGKK